MTFIYVRSLSQPEIHNLYYFKEKLDLYMAMDVTKLPLFPKEDPTSDRVVNQLLYEPPNYEIYSKNPSKQYKQISFYRERERYWPDLFNYGTDNFLKCKVFTCNISKLTSTADLVIFTYDEPTAKSRNDQLHMFFTMESPLHAVRLNGPFDWISTYRRDSDIVADYGTWQYYDPNVRQLPQTTNYAAGKRKKVAWFVTNCRAPNNRLEIALEMQKYIQVDIYGPCTDSKLSCSRSRENECFEMLEKEYKFYLAFENSNCRDYMTEKVYKNALKHKVLPIVMGARPEDYRKYMPEHSFIHVDDFETVEDLANYLNLLDRDDNLYNSYFQWRGTGEIIDKSYFWCRVCAMLHNPNMNREKFALTGTSLKEYWRGDGICTQDNWKPK
ncbi:glycoprotein 3-alpha-L-fucosyltransferase A-like [Culicoides brevitarsis]|uniref:glycoprotein 3-alpha-L-fucosyltransferase A-like n=1 Tax=Culicoides brevitarsis TaxID=469753 RepID=UPI00307B70BE